LSEWVVGMIGKGVSYRERGKRDTVLPNPSTAYFPSRTNGFSRFHRHDLKLLCDDSLGPASSGSGTDGFGKNVWLSARFYSGGAWVLVTE
jgi:hypothetical protein